MNNITKEQRIKGAFFGSIVGDALCLGSHYEYDAEKIYKAYGNKSIEKFMSPGEMMGGQTHGIGWGAQNYHPGKQASGTNGVEAIPRKWEKNLDQWDYCEEMLNKLPLLR